MTIKINIYSLFCRKSSTSVPRFAKKLKLITNLFVREPANAQSALSRSFLTSVQCKIVICDQIVVQTIL